MAASKPGRQLQLKLISNSSLDFNTSNTSLDLELRGPTVFQPESSGCRRLPGHCRLYPNDRFIIPFLPWILPDLATTQAKPGGCVFREKGTISISGFQPPKKKWQRKILIAGY